MNSIPKILIVDDDKRNLSIISLTLEDLYPIETAICGEAALEKIEIFWPDIILLDIMMPGIDGYEVCRKIREDHK